MSILSRPYPKPGAGGGSGGASFADIPGTGILGVNRGHARALPVVAGSGMDIRNPDMVGGKIVFTAINQSLFYSADKVPLNATTALQMPMCCKGARYFAITHIWFKNSTGTPDANFRASLFTLPNKAGVNLMPPGQSFTSMVDDFYSTLRVAVPTVLQEQRAVPFLYFVPEVANGAAMTVDIRVQGDLLDWEI